MAYVFLCFLYLMYSIPISSLAQSNGTIAVGSSLTANNNVTPWFSPSGDFAFGFQQTQNTDLFILSIWYDKIPEKTIVWFPSGEEAKVARGSRIELTADRGLVLTNPQGTEQWKSSDLLGQVSYGVMNDTGNFELVRRDSFRIWSTFQHPSDTLLPTQIMGRGGVLYPRMTQTNFSRGRFVFRFQQDGNLVFNTQNVPYNFQYDAYYASGTDDRSNSSNSGQQLIFNATGYLYILKENGQRLDLTSRMVRQAEDNYFRATFSFDGVFTQYYHPRYFSGNPGWNALWWEPNNICDRVGGNEGSGVCGFNSICKLQDLGRPSCECPKVYSLLDPNDQFGSCKPNFTQSCDDDLQTSSGESLYDFEEITNTDWPTSDYEHMDPISKEDCRNSCATDCFCAVAIYRGTSCWKKKLPLSNGRYDPQLMAKAFLKFRKGDLPQYECPGHSLPPQKKNDQSSLVLIGSVFLGSSVFVNFILIATMCSGYFLIYQKKSIMRLQDSKAVDSNLRCFSYRELAEATNGFKEELGRGAFGIVYKGILGTTSKNFVAVKKLEKLVVESGDKEFKTEVEVIAKTHQKNLVSLLGFCYEGEHRLLVYEYMSNGTLASFLFADNKPSWRLRTRIALGVAKGLSYLHEECSTQIIHCDIKPQNVLLDDYLEPRISDFGLSKVLRINQSRTNTGIRGTKGYVAPEWFRNTPVTVKVDVYSFGVLLLEIISCRRSVWNLENDGDGDEEKAILTDWVWDCYQQGEMNELVDNDLEALSEGRKLETFVKIGIWCIQEDPFMRPTMRKVAQMLEGNIQVTEPPCPSPFSISG